MSDNIKPICCKRRISPDKTASDTADTFESMSQEFDGLLADAECEIFDAFSAGYDYGRKAGIRDARREAQR